MQNNFTFTDFVRVQARQPITKNDAPIVLTMLIMLCLFLEMVYFFLSI